MAEKKYGGAPFGTQTARFDVSGVHPQSKMPGTYTQVPYCKKATTTENKLLGPGTYSTETGDFTPRAIDQNMKGPNWERAQDVAKLASIPHVLYRNQWEHKRQLVELLGPGRYTVKDFVEEMNSKPSSSRGVCQSRDTRLIKENKFHSSLPGPGTYGKGGVPWASLEEKNKQSVSTVGMLDAGGPKLSKMQAVGSDLAPGQYKCGSSIERLLKKTISKRGPYDLYTGERYKTAKQLTQTRHLAPGKYDLKPFTDDLKDHHHKKHGRFSTLPQCPEPPTERIFCSTLSQWPRRKEDPGPGHFEMRRERIKSAPCRYPFNSSAERIDKRQQTYFNGSLNPVGAGQYDINKWHNHRHVNANVSVFVSETPRLPKKVDSPRELLLNERIHPKGVPVSKRQFLVPVKAPF